MTDTIARPGTTTTRGYRRATALREPSPTVDRSARTIWPVSWRAFGYWLAAYFAFTTIWVAVGTAVTQWWEGSPAHRAEEDVARWFEDIRSPAWTELSHWISFSSDAVPKTVFIAVLAATFVVLWRRLHDAVFLIATMGLELAVFATTSTVVGRERPPVEQLDGSLPTSSFPSGHVAATVALYAALAVIVHWHTRRAAIRRAAIAVAVVWPLTMLIVRVYRGMHYVSDVVMGTVLGLACVAVVVAVMRIGTADRRRDPAPLPARARTLDQTDDTRRDRTEESAR